MSVSLYPWVHPKHLGRLEVFPDRLFDPKSGESFPMVDGIPRFFDAENYSSSFGFQWDQFARTQLDLHTGTDHSEQRFYSQTGWNPETLDQFTVLEVGSGAGRFTEVFLRTTKGVLDSVDSSTAVDVNRRNNLANLGRLRLAQASIYELPYPDEFFQKVFCFGVLQHTPSFNAAVAKLVCKTKIGGEIVVDFYSVNGWYTKVHAKYIFRPLLRRLSKPALLRLIKANIGWMTVVFDALCVMRLGALTRLIPIADLRILPKKLAKDQRREWAVLDTFDCFSPKYDSPQKMESVVRMFEERGCDVFFADKVSHSTGSSAVVRAIRRA